MNKPNLCGSNRINIPDSGCSDCDALQYQIDQIKEWIEEFEEEGYNALANKPTINGVTVEGDKTSEDYLIKPISAADIIELTPIECYTPPCQDSRACYGEACCMLVGCNTSDSSIVCEGGVCYAEVSCDEPPTPPTPTPQPGLSATIDVMSVGEAEGENIELLFTITNTGDVALTDITVTEPKTGNEWTIDELGVGEMQTYGDGDEEEDKILYPITAEDITAGKVDFVLTASTTYDGTAVTATETETVDLGGGGDEDPKHPSLEVSSTYSMEAEVAGSEVTINHTIENNGDVALTGVTATSQLTGSTWTIGDLAVGGHYDAEVKYTIKTSDVESGEIEIDLSATGTYEEEAVTASNTEVITLGESEEEEPTSEEE